MKKIIETENVIKDDKELLENFSKKFKIPREKILNTIEEQIEINERLPEDDIKEQYMAEQHLDYEEIEQLEQSSIKPFIDIRNEIPEEMMLLENEEIPLLRIPEVDEPQIS